ncbi:MAG: MoxR family ATPase [Actinomycetota bacterium]|nr:MoxR family ATPase [Actinomycetota bacterium]
MPPRARTRKAEPAQLTSAAFQERFELMTANIGLVLKGKDDVIRLSLTALLANGHLLFEDFPGTGKTVLARAISHTVSAATNRVQCTPDLLPADITGFPILDRRTGDFAFRAGPLFTNVFLADEINRATPKTQSALLEAMAERTVTVDGTTHALPKPFFVLATENPVELAGTFPLPEAQLDRFLFKLSLGYASPEAEVEVLMAHRLGEAIDGIGPVVSTAELVAMVDWANQVEISPAVARYIVDICQVTRTDPALQMGASSRAALALMRASRVVAASQGRDDVLPDDVRLLVRPVLGHRLLLTPDAQLREETVDAVIDRLLGKVKPPLGLSRREPPGPAGASELARAGA